LINYQYIDCRGARYRTGLGQLSQQLRKVILVEVPKISVANTPNACPPGFVPILIPKTKDRVLDLRTGGRIFGFDSFGRFDSFGERFGEKLQVVVINPDRYPSFEELLHDLYIHFLRAKFKPYTYGKDWVLARVAPFVNLIAVPSMWLKHKRKKLLIDVIPDYLQKKTPLKEFGFASKSSMQDRGVWAVIDEGFDKAFGLFSSNEALASLVFDNKTKSLYFILNRYLELGSPSTSNQLGDGIYSLHAVNPIEYRYRFVIVPDYFYGDKEVPEDAVLVVNNMSRR